MFCRIFLQRALYPSFENGQYRKGNVLPAVYGQSLRLVSVSLAVPPAPTFECVRRDHSATQGTAALRHPVPNESAVWNLTLIERTARPAIARRWFPLAMPMAARICWRRSGVEFRDEWAVGLLAGRLVQQSQRAFDLAGAAFGTQAESGFGIEFDQHLGGHFIDQPIQWRATALRQCFESAMLVVG
jgi:hypothetical protein